MQHDKVKCDRIHLERLDIQFLQKVTCNGVIIDAELSTMQQVRGVTSRCFHQQRQIRTVRKSLIAETSTLLVHAFINNSLDYCNSVLYDVGAVLLRKLQSIRNGVAQVVARKRKSHPITSTYRGDLHWLPVEWRICFKQCMLVCKSFLGTDLVYIAEISKCIIPSGLPSLTA